MVNDDPGGIVQPERDLDADDATVESRSVASSQASGGLNSDLTTEMNVGARSVAEVLGQVVLLAMRSTNMRHLFIADLEWTLLPPILLKQFRLYRSNGDVVGFASWAPSEWRSRNILCCC
ncbi:protein of unknown function [Magnetospira sp. QH-2]|nr:protein of unknown function [Magnetospira sp. QH-2]